MERRRPDITSETGVSINVILAIATAVLAAVMAFASLQGRISVVEQRQSALDQRLQRIEDRLDRLLSIAEARR
jgi:cell division protein ZapA (FtsZ GTPase activity inhibitor)